MSNSPEQPEKMESRENLNEAVRQGEKLLLSLERELADLDRLKELEADLSFEEYQKSITAHIDLKEDEIRAIWDVIAFLKTCQGQEAKETEVAKLAAEAEKLLEELRAELKNLLEIQTKGINFDLETYQQIIEKEITRKKGQIEILQLLLKNLKELE